MGPGRKIPPSHGQGLEIWRFSNMGADNQSEKVIAVMDATETFVRDMLVLMNGRLPDEKTIEATCRKIRAYLRKVAAGEARDEDDDHAR
jgi:hypothetical protein